MNGLKGVCRGAAIGALLTGISAGANAEWGVSTGVVTLSPCPSFCGGQGSAFGNDSHPNLFGETSSSTLTNQDGSGTASATLFGTHQLPDLKADALSHAQNGAQRSSLVTAQATGMREFVYDGASSVTSLNVVLTGSAVSAAGVPGSVVAQIVAVKGLDVPFSTSFGTFVFEIIPLTPGLTLIDTLELEIPANQGSTSVTGAINIALDPGDHLFIWANLVASGTRGGSGDASHTLTSSFSSAAGLTAVTAVPIPAALPLMLSGLGLLRFRRALQAA